MLTLASIIAAIKFDRAYGGDGTCAHRFGGPEPQRPRVTHTPETHGPGVWLRLHNPETGMWDYYSTPYTGEPPPPP